MEHAEVARGLDAGHQQMLDALLRLVEAAEIEKHLWPGDTVTHYCLRFLFARKFDLEKALAMLRADLAWRAKHRPKELLLQHPLDVVGMSIEDVEQYLPLWHQGYDKLGRPFLVMRFGKVRLPELQRRTTMDKVHRLQLRMAEAAVRSCGSQSLKLGRPTGKWLVLVDARSMDLKSMLKPAALKLLGRIADIDQKHYPERLGAMIVINAPRVFHALYPVMSHFVDETTRQKIHLYPDMVQGLTALHELVELSQISPEYGGTGKCMLRHSLARMATSDFPDPDDPELQEIRSLWYRKRRCKTSF